MNWLRSKLRAWLCLDLDTAGKEAIVDVVLIGQQSTQLEQQQREIRALRGEVVMLKRQVTMQSLPSWTTDGTMQEVELLKANQQADTIAMLKADRAAERPVNVPGPTDWERYAVPVNAGEVWLTDHNWAEGRRP